MKPPSHCDSCDTPLKSIDNIPVVSYVVLRGKCRASGSRIPPRDLILELVTAGLFVLFAWRLPTLWALPAYCVFAGGLVPLSAIDIKLHRLPTPIVYWTAGIGGALLIVASAGIDDWNRLLQALVGGAACFAVFLAIYLVVPKGMGFGDVRLAGLCGAFLGWLDIRYVPIGLLTAFVVAGAPALLLLILGRVNRKTQMPFGPFLAVGAIIGVSFGRPILHVLGVI